MYKINISDMIDNTYPIIIMFNTKTNDLDYNSSILNTIQDKADFLYTMICRNSTQDELYLNLSQIQKSLAIMGVKCSFNSPNNSIINAGCDNNIKDFLSIIYTNANTLYCYLFSSNSNVTII